MRSLLPRLTRFGLLLAAATAAQASPTLSSLQGQVPSEPLSHDVNHFIPIIWNGESSEGLFFAEFWFATVDGSGISNGTATFIHRELVSESLSQGDAYGGSFRSRIRVPRGQQPGNYRLIKFLLVDSIGGQRVWSNDPMPGVESMLPASVAFAVAAAPWDENPPDPVQDSADPVLLESRLSPDAVDLLNEAAFVTLDLTCADDTGVEWVDVWLVSPDSMLFIPAATSALESVVSGDERSGTVRLTIRLDQNLPTGWWRLGAVVLRDRAGRAAMYQAGAPKFEGFGDLLVIRGDEDGDGRLLDDFFPHDPTRWERPAPDDGGPGNPPVDGDRSVALTMMRSENGVAASLRFGTRPEKRYRVEFSTDLANWRTIVSDIPGNGLEFRSLMPPQRSSHGYFRVAEE